MTYTPHDALHEALEREQDAGVVALWPSEDEAWVRFGNARLLLAWTRRNVYALRDGSTAPDDVCTSWESAPRAPVPEAEHVGQGILAADWVEPQ